MHIHPLYGDYYYYYYNKGVYLCILTLGGGGGRFEAYLEIHKIYCLTINIYTE